jgi:hypothetical protein
LSELATFNFLLPNYIGNRVKGGTAFSGACVLRMARTRRFGFFSTKKIFGGGLERPLRTILSVGLSPVSNVVGIGKAYLAVQKKTAVSVNLAPEKTRQAIAKHWEFQS